MIIAAQNDDSIMDTIALELSVSSHKNGGAFQLF